MIALVAMVLTGQSCVAQQAVSYAPVQYQQQAYNQAYVEKTIFVAVEAQDAPAYYGGLVASQQRQAERQQQAQQAAATTDQKLDQLSRLVEQLQRKLEAQPNEQSQPRQQLLPPRPNPAVSPPPLAAEAVPPPPTINQASRRAGHPGLSVLTTSCAGCHTSGSSKGGGIILFTRDGSWTPRDRETLESVEAAIANGRMPKGPQKLTLRESANILSFLDEQAGRLAVNTANQRKKPL